ncbi:hypothetical protein [Streptomyces californicus]|uniref:hypothetical protein n=1 Tax=Streptomyces californicus TaxID=67351 RepID=UPI0033E8FD91
MTVTPIPGTHRDNVLSALWSVSVAAGNLDSQHHSSAYGRLLAYLEWVNESLRMLVSQISASDIDRLIRTRMYQSLLDGVGHLAGSDQQRLVNGLLTNEVRERVVALGAAVDAFQVQMQRWPAMTSVLVLDTSVFIKHEKKLEDIELLRVGHRSGDGPWGATDEAPGLLIEMSDVSTTLLGGLVGRPSCRTRPAACTRGVGHYADHHP